MEQYPPSNPAITWWLGDYTHFICDQLGLPHEQGHQLFQQYHWLTTGLPPQQPASLCGYPTAYPEMPVGHHNTHSQEQSSRASLDDGFQNLPVSNSGSSHEHSIGEKVDHPCSPTAMIAPNVAPRGLFSSDNQQPGKKTSDLDVLKTISPSMQSNGASIHNPIGSIADYDPLWVQHNNVDPMTVKNFHTSMKFDTLFTHNVIKFGDILAFQVSVNANGQPFRTEAHLKIIGSSKPQGRCGSFPDLSVTLLLDPSRQYPIATSCMGTKAMIEHLESTCNMMVLASAWQHIQVIRGEQALGNLRYFTKAFHLWRDWKDQEARETGRFFRPRRAQRVKDTRNPIVHHEGRFGVWRDGVFVPDPDQGQFRAGG